MKIKYKKNVIFIIADGRSENLTIIFCLFGLSSAGLSQYIISSDRNAHKIRRQERTDLMQQIIRHLRGKRENLARGNFNCYESHNHWLRQQQQQQTILTMDCSCEYSMSTSTIIQILKYTRSLNSRFRMWRIQRNQFVQLDVCACACAAWDTFIFSRIYVHINFVRKSVALCRLLNVCFALFNRFAVHVMLLLLLSMRDETNRSI